MGGGGVTLGLDELASSDAVGELQFRHGTVMNAIDAMTPGHRIGGRSYYTGV